MLGFTAAQRYYLSRQAADMRKIYDGQSKNNRMKNIKIKYIISCLTFCFVFILAHWGEVRSQSVRLEWINFSPFTEPGQNPESGSIVPESQIICLLDTLRPWVEGIRTFETKHGLENAPFLAKQRGLNVIVGIWLGNESTPAGLLANQEQIASGIAIANAGYADRLIVGSEVLRRGDLTPAQLIAYINEVKMACPNIPVSYADICSKLIEFPEVADACDFVSPNIYPFWEQSPVECAMQRFHQCYLDILPIANGKEIFISESGWKTAGNPVGAAVPSFENAIRYNRELLGWSQAFGVDVNIFSAFDEPWKLPNDDGWGIFFHNKIMKPGMDTLFTPFIGIDSTWLCMKLNNLSTDTLHIDYLPVIGSYLPIKGHIDHLNPCDYRIATYIKVGGWWNKPTWDNPTVPILCNGTWSVNYTTGGSDALATDICVFVVPSSYSPPLCNGCGVIPAEVYQNAIASDCIHRYELDSVTLTASDDTICREGITTLTATGGAIYLWSTGETTASIQVSPGFNGTIYSVSISDGLGGGAITTITISVLSPTFYYIVSNPSSICLGDTSVLTPLTTDDVTEYLWNTGETTNTINVFPDSTTTYTVTITNAVGCTDTGPGIVYVYDYPSLIINAFPDSICIGENSSIEVYSGFAASYLWSTGTSSSGSGSSETYVEPTTTSTYTVTVTYSNGCTDVAQATVFVSPFPIITVEANPDTIQTGSTATLTADGGGIGATYLWSTGETAPSIQVSPTATKTYSVTCTNSIGCNTTAAVTLTVIPFVSTKNIDTIESIKIYPNPANGMFVIELKVSDSGFVKISLLDEMGYILEQRTEQPTMGAIVSHFDIAFLPAGLYFLKLQTENGEFLTEKVLKEHGSF
ncbi:MAG: T9SS type A sorting domain-containing protein [Saprospirales bacterium]|nr:T9SS type A sorting domain-containing protein [Saprospirales bacterium]MBK8921068.1 T9SS type A sorting domain-containing protein [Saprospirales bacterium]